MHLTGTVLSIANFIVYSLVSSGFAARLEFPGRVVDIAVSRDAKRMAVLLPNSIRVLSTDNGSVIRTVAAGAPSLSGITFSPDGTWVAAPQLDTAVYGLLLAETDGSTIRRIALPPGSLPAGLAYSPDGSLIYVLLNRSNRIAVIDVASGEVRRSAETGVAPVAIALSQNGDRLYVTNWGGRRPAPGFRTASSSGSATLVDDRGIAASGSVSVFDATSLRFIAEVDVGLHPLAIRLSPDGGILAVANSNSDTVTVLDAFTLDTLRTLHVPLRAAILRGASPTAVTFSNDGRRLFVACAGLNIVAVFRCDSEFALETTLPTDRYPIAVEYAAGKVLIANSKGVKPIGTPRSRQFTGTVVSRTEPPTNDLPPVNLPHRRPAGSDLRRLGIEHVFLIIKENRTYDQILGDAGIGNGDPKLALYGESVTPNQHKLAREFVLLDNFMVNGEVSADGHQWLTQAMTTAYIERSQPAGWPRSYPYMGDDPLAFSYTGFIWNNAQVHGLSYRLFGEFTSGVAGHGRSWTDYYHAAQAGTIDPAVRSASSIAGLNVAVEPSYPSFALNIPDSYRAMVFLDRFAAFEKTGDLPNLNIIQLPADHTVGMAPGLPSPASMVADNDVAVGRIVEAISRSRYWARSVIFVVEDDAQDGVDHVDGHRSVCLVISPFIRRQQVDSTEYDQVSILRTIEDLLGMGPMNRFDAAAVPMSAAFTSTPDLTPYAAVPNQVPLDQLNPQANSLTGSARRAAIESAAMDFTRPDAAPAAKLNRILWNAQKGWTSRYPRVRHQPTCSRESE